MENKEIKFVVLTQEILITKNLTPVEKLILARYSGFSELFESPTSTAKLLGVSVESVHRARQKFEKMGILVCFRNDGRGKAFHVNHDVLLSRLVKFTKQISKIYQSDCSNLLTENKEENKIKNKDIKKEITFDSVFEKKNVSDELKSAFLDFIQMRKTIGAKLTSRGLELAIDKVRKLADDEPNQIEIINQSVEKSWRGLFPIYESNNKQIEL